MQFVLDTNQISPLIADVERLKARPDGVTLCTEVLAELIQPLDYDPKAKLVALDRVGLTLGLQFEDAIGRLKSLTPNEILQFRPFPAPGKDAFVYDCIWRQIRQPGPLSEKLVEWASRNKSRFRETMKGFVERAKVLRAKILERSGSKKTKPKVASLDEAIAAWGTGASSDLGAITLRAVFQSRLDSMELKDREEAYAAIMANTFVGRFFRTLFCYLLSYGGLWSEEKKKLNFAPSSDEDDWTDIILAMYADAGDIIVTADTKLTNAMSQVEPNAVVKCIPVEKLV